MLRVLQTLPNKCFKSCYGSVYRANRGTAETQKRRKQDGVIVPEVVQRLFGSSAPGTVHVSSLHTSSRCGSLGNHSKQSEEEWQRSFNQRIEWDSFKRNNYACEAVGWGSIIVLGLQLSRMIAASAPQEKREKKDSILSLIAQAVPDVVKTKPFVGARSVLPASKEQRTRSFDSTTSSGVESSEARSWESESSGSSLYSDSSLASWSTDSRPSITHSSVSDSSVSHSSVNESASFAQVAANNFHSHLDQITSRCRSQVNNIIGGQFMAEGEEEKAVQHFQLASEAGYSKGQYNLGMCYELGRGVQRDAAQAAVLFSLAAKQGHPQALYKLGTYYLEGIGDITKCHQTAIALITEAADGGVPQAQSYLGVYYMTCKEKNPEKAVLYLKAAAAQKDCQAEYHLGMCYEFGWGVEGNTAKAASLYHSAANKGHTPSLYALGLFYEQGLGGLPENFAQAREMYSKASDAGFEKASERLLQMDAEMAKIQADKRQNRSSIIENQPEMNKDKFMHPSASAPELIRKQETNSQESCGLDMNSILRSLSYLSLVFPHVPGGWMVNSNEDLAGGDSPKVNFQLGGLEDDEGPDWCDPIDSIAQQSVGSRLVSFNKATMVI